MKRNTVKGWIPTTGMILVLAAGAFANGGIVVDTAPSSNGIVVDTAPCKEGIVVSDSPISVVIDFINGMLISDLKEEEASCGEDSKNGMLISD